MTNLSNFNRIKAFLTQHHVTLVAVSKMRHPDIIRLLYQNGQRIFGENRVQELLEKVPQLPADIQWHLIGHLQTNKVKHVIQFVSMIHSGDRLKLLRKINQEAKEINRTIPVLIQVKIAEEVSKYGFHPNELLADDVLAEIAAFTHIDFQGVMGMATFSDNQEQIRKEFRLLNSVFNQLKQSVFSNKPNFAFISMGMSGDYKLAIEEGSNMVRIGTALYA